MPSATTTKPVGANGTKRAVAIANAVYPANATAVAFHARPSGRVSRHAASTVRTSGIWSRSTSAQA